MELALFLGSLGFWILYYVFEGTHDVAFIQEIRLARSHLDAKTNADIEPAIVERELSWKFWNSLEKGLTKVFFAILIVLITGDYWFAFLLLALSFWIRWLVHDLTVALGLGNGIRHIGPDFIWTDRMLRRIERVGVSQYAVKLLPLAATIALILWSI